MAEAYYSSDEDIAWGPLQPKELKKHLFRETRPLNRRFSEFSNWDKYYKEKDESSSDYHSTMEELEIKSVNESKKEEIHNVNPIVISDDEDEMKNKANNHSNHENSGEIVEILDELENYERNSENDSFTNLSSSVANLNFLNESNLSENSPMNDTIDEIEMFLNCNNSEKTPSEYSTTSTEFKTPLKPIIPKPKRTTPQTSNSKRYDYVISPVALYIKNSRPFIKQTVSPIKTQKPISQQIHLKKSDHFLSTDETISELPEIVYKPRQQRIVQKEEIHLPTTYQKIIKDATAIEHKKAHNNHLNQSTIQEKLCDTNISILSNTHSENYDISFVNAKKPFF